MLTKAFNELREFSLSREDMLSYELSELFKGNLREVEKLERAEARAEGRQEGREAALLQTAKAMLEGGIPMEQIAKMTGLNHDQIRSTAFGQTREAKATPDTAVTSLGKVPAEKTDPAAKP
jgi:predicted transposase/invertase (TIGR01784 family)